MYVHIFTSVQKVVKKHLYLNDFNNFFDDFMLRFVSNVVHIFVPFQVQ